MKGQNNIWNSFTFVFPHLHVDAVNDFHAPCSPLNRQHEDGHGNRELVNICMCLGAKTISTIDLQRRTKLLEPSGKASG